MPNSQRIKVIPKRFCGTSLNLGSSCIRFHASHQRKGNKKKFRFGNHRRAVNRISKDVFSSNKSAGMSTEMILRKEGERRRQSDCPIRPPPSPDKLGGAHKKHTQESSAEFRGKHHTRIGYEPSEIQKAVASLSFSR